MNEILMLLVILIPIIGGILIPIIPFKNRKVMCIYIESFIVLTSILVVVLMNYPPKGVYELLQFTGNLSITLNVDGMTLVFASLVAFLWPLATLYAFEYMKKEGHEKIFFMFYSITYGITLGISLSGNFLTMYFFYELLTLVTVPLVVHTLSREAIMASRTYLYYSLGGAAFAFIGLIFIIMYGYSTEFILGGVLNTDLIGNKKDLLLFIYVIAFLGFGVKAALFPFNAWLPKASVAPTPVTALLHAVAVVKAGAFALIRLTYYSFGADFLRDTWAQTTVMIFVIITMIYASSMALKETNLKRRLAYSTIGNLSYILFGITLMTTAGMEASLAHMIFHSLMKICCFFCAGAIIYKSHVHYIYELNGMAKKMPFIFFFFTLASFSLMGVPGFVGFISKFRIATAALETNNILAFWGVAALLISAFLTAIYMLSIIVRGYFLPLEHLDESKEKITDPGVLMKFPIGIIGITIVLLSIITIINFNF
ncbi:MAG: complex I subunit 5 family protein [Lachnospiraceae bacterium]